jgi:exodeoxyribonuclease VII large subunit
MVPTIPPKALRFKLCAFGFAVCSGARYTRHAMPEIHVYSVSEINHSAKEVLEEKFGEIWVRGEISNLTIAASGHAYFSLVDGESEISAARFRSRIPLSPETVANGVEVLALGRLTIYEPRGRYQLVVSLIHPAGLGAQQIAFEQLKEKLRAEGLFAPERRKPLPRIPRRIGVVTSSSGAALRDVVSVLQRRWPVAELVVLPSAVQGVAAASELVAAVETAGLLHESETPLDVLIITRGGGSAEDLAAFNDEAVVRAVSACPVPTVSAVGHEVDVTITDFVADQRAPTPSAAAELVTPDGADLIAQVVSRSRERAHRIHGFWRATSDRTDHHLRSYVLRVPARRLESFSQRFDQVLSTMHRAIGQRWTRLSFSAATLATSIGLSDPNRPLQRGYSLTFLKGADRPLRDAMQAPIGSRIITHLDRGTLDSEVKEVPDIHDDR